MNRFATWIRYGLDQLLSRRETLSAVRKSKRLRSRLQLEQLEDRTLMSGNPTISWDGGGGDPFWLNPLNWTEDRLPGPNDDVEIRVVDQQITVFLAPPAGTTPAIHSLTSEENLTIAGGLSLAAASEVTGSLTVTSGVVQFLSETANFSGGGAIAGTLDISADATVQFASGPFHWQNGAALTGNGYVRITGATVQVTDHVTANKLELRGGSLGGTGNLTVNSNLDWSGGALLDSGAINVASGAQLNINDNGLPQSPKYLWGRTINNAGTATWSGNGGIASDQRGGRFNNLLGGTFTVEGDATFMPQSPEQVDLIFNNEGTFRKVGGEGTTRFDLGYFNNHGTVELLAGTLLLGGQGTSSGTFVVQEDAVLQFGYCTHTLAAASSTLGDGTVLFSQNGVVNLNGSYNVTRTEIQGGVANFNASATSFTTLFSAGTLGGVGSFSTTSTFDWTGGSMAGTPPNPGSTVIPTGATLNITGANPTYLHGRTINNSGTVVWQGGLSIASDERGGVFNNLAGGTFLATGDATFMPQSPRMVDLVFSNAGTFRKTGSSGTTRFDWGHFNNEGLVDILTGTLWLGGEGLGSGTWTVSQGAFLEFGSGSHLVGFGSTVTGNGTVTFGADVDFLGTYNARVTRITAGSLTLETQATTTLAVMSGGVLDGSGTLTTTIAFDWSGGTMSGSGVTEIAATATLMINGDGPKFLDGRELDRKGAVAWIGNGTITRPSTNETYSNEGVRPNTAQADFSAIAAAATIYRAMYGGLFGAGTEEDPIYAVLAGKTEAQITAIREAYSFHYTRNRGTVGETSRNMDQDLQNDLGPTEWQRVQALLNGNRLRADAAALNYAMFGGISIGTDVKTIYRILERGPIAGIAAEYQSMYGENPHRENALRQDLDSDFDGIEWVRVEALLDGNRATADAAGLHYALVYSSLGYDVDEDEIYHILSGKTSEHIEAIRSEYDRLYGQFLPSGALDFHLRAQLSTNEYQYAQALMEGDSLLVAVRKLHLAMDGLGTDKTMVWKTLEGKTSDQRAMIAQLYQQEYDVELKADIEDDFLDNPITGNDRSRTFALLYRGGLSLAETIWYGVKGAGTDLNMVRQAIRILATKPTTLLCPCKNVATCSCCWSCFI